MHRPAHPRLLTPPSRTERPPRGRRRALLAALAASSSAALVLLGAVPASAVPLWDGDASGGTTVFAGDECPAPGALSIETDGAGDYFRFQKSVGTYRCEVRGVRVDGAGYAFAENETYWLGWEQNLGFTSEGPEGDRVSWQWKSYPNADQNYPLLMRVDNGRLYLTYVAPGGVWSTLWSTPVETGIWNDIALGIHTSGSETGGWVELYYNGIQQTFSDGSTRFTGRTWDSANQPKWGAYDRDNTAYEIVNRVRQPRIGTTLGDVD